MPNRNKAAAPRGRMIEIGGGRILHAVFAGPLGANPLVVLEAGAFGLSADWAAVQDLLARQGLRSMAYDRAGLGRSPAGPEPRDGAAIAGDLERLLASANEPGPLILCAHSMAGLHARLFAARNAGNVAGVVLVDATTPEAMDSKTVRGFVDQFAIVSRLAAWGADTGLFGPLAGTRLGDSIGLEGAAGLEKRRAFADADHNRWASSEVDSWAHTAKQAREAGDLPPELPVAVILAGAPGALLSGFQAVQVVPAQRSASGYIESVPGASHATMLNSTFAEAIGRGVDHVIEAARRLGRL